MDKMQDWSIGGVYAHDLAMRYHLFGNVDT